MELCKWRETKLDIVYEIAWKIAFTREIRDIQVVENLAMKRGVIDKMGMITRSVEKQEYLSQHIYIHYHHPGRYDNWNRKTGFIVNSNSLWEIKRHP